MRPSRAKGPRQFRALALAAVLVASIFVVAPALGAYGLLAQFGHTGSGPGTIGPHAPAIAVDPSGRVYVADVKDGRIEAFTNDGTPDGGWGGHTDLTGLAAAPDGTLIVADAAGVRRLAVDGTVLETLSTAAPLGGVAVAGNGRVYAADPAGHRVLVFGGAPITGLGEPVAVGVSFDGTVYVGDLADGRVHAFGLTDGSWHVGDPRGIAAAPDGTVFVADGQGNRVVHLLHHGAVEDVFGGVNAPKGVATDCRGRAYVVDNSALRVRVFGQDGPPPPCPAPPEPTPQQEVQGVTAVAEPAPLVGVRARASAVAGKVRVGKGKGLRNLGRNELIPVGSTVDATEGRVKLEFETASGGDRDRYGRLMDGEFYDGAFVIEQKPGDSLVDLKMLDEDKPRATTALARAAASKKLKVWGKARGRFRTVGRNGAATVRGTQWLTEERDDGTLFRVREGVVEVEEFYSGDRVVLEAGETYLARPECVSRRNFRIRLRTRIKPNEVRRATVTIDGRPVPVRRGRRLTAPIDLRGLPRQRVVVRIRLVTKSGQVIAGRRVYRTCSGDQRPSRPPEL